MPTSYCPSCGAEYVEGVFECADCFVPLVAELPQPSGDEVVFELDDWEPELLDLVSDQLGREGIPFTWEGNRELVVPEAVSGRVEEVLDAVEGGNDEDDEVDDEPVADATFPEGSADEVPYDAVSDLFVAADRLFHAPEDGAVVAEVMRAALAIEATIPPYGVPADVWAKVRGLAAALRHDLGVDADDDAISERARDLRDSLRAYV